MLRQLPFLSTRNARHNHLDFLGGCTASQFACVLQSLSLIHMQISWKTGQSLTMVQIKEAGTRKGWNISGSQIGRWLRRKGKKKGMQATDVVYTEFPYWSRQDDAWELTHPKICRSPDLYSPIFPWYNGCYSSETNHHTSCPGNYKVSPIPYWGLSKLGDLIYNT